VKRKLLLKTQKYLLCVVGMEDTSFAIIDTVIYKDEMRKLRLKYGQQKKLMTI